MSMLCRLSFAKLSLLLFLIFDFGCFVPTIQAQDLTVNGYQKYMNTILFSETEDPWLVDNMLHNRLKLNWYVGQWVQLNLEARTRLIYGDFLQELPGYRAGIEDNKGFLDLNYTLSSGSSYILTSLIDRANISYTQGAFSITLGRQRINWSQTFAFNPNDLFNSYSFFDFDYEEKPGADAVRLHYYPNYTSEVQMAVKMDKNNKITAAAYYRFNKWNYDWQILSGILPETDIVLGTGWSGSIKDFGFTGELTCLSPYSALFEEVNILISSGVNYLFENSLQVQGEFFYNSYAQQNYLQSILSFYHQNLGIKQLSFSRWSWFLQGTYPIHPLLQGSLGIMYYPDYEMYFLMPSLRYSLSDNYELAIYGQRFSGNFGNGQTDQLNMLFLRFRWSY